MILSLGVALVDKLTMKPDAIYDFPRGPLMDKLKKANDAAYDGPAFVFENDAYGPLRTGSTFPSSNSKWYNNGVQVRFCFPENCLAFVDSF